ncbi:hypothetical protein P8C59_000048 [Phyllachora maydis]|uniref:Uncharacterized protein n=1 Tax=Phyllachora maydis TaxID=1825666 RepID=A0AAD9M9U5_9PEZI|nr:hypothetical protein P8C59_000048 [Phyllachora maydis]
MADQAKGKGIAPKRASNPANSGQSSRPPLPIRTLLEDKEDGKDYSEVIEVLKQYIKSHKRVIASQSSNIKTLLLSLNTLKASIKDSISAIKNISSTLASLTNSSNAAATRKTSYSPRFDSFSSTMDLDSPPRPPRKEPYLGPAIDNTATSNLDTPIDTGSKEGFKDTITSSIVKELSKKAYTIPDDNILEESRNPAIEAYRAAYIANSSNSTPNSNSNPSKKGKNKKKGKKKASYNVKGQNYSAKSAKQASFMLGSYNLAKEEEEESNSSSNSSLTSYNTTKSIELPRNKIVVEIPSNSIRKEEYRPIIEDAIVSKAIEPKKTFFKGEKAPGEKVEKAISSPTLKEPNIEAIVELVNSTAITNKETTPFQALFDELEPGIPHIPNLERYRAIGARGEAIIPLEKQSKSLKFTSRTEECKLLAVLGSKTYLVYIPSRRAVLKTSTIKFIEDNTVLSQPTNNTALEGELVDLDLDLDGAVSLDPSNLNTEKPISIEIGPSKLEPYESSSNKPIFIPKPIEVIAPNQPITNDPLNNSNLISKGDKMQLDYYKLLAKTSSYILSFVYKARKRVISKDSTPTTYKQVLKLPRDERRVFYNSKTCHFIVTYIDDCLFIGPDIGYITDLKKRLNKVYAIRD